MKLNSCFGLAKEHLGFDLWKNLEIFLNFETGYSELGKDDNFRLFFYGIGTIEIWYQYIRKFRQFWMVNNESIR